MKDSYRQRMWVAQDSVRLPKAMDAVELRKLQTRVTRSKWWEARFVNQGRVVASGNYQYTVGGCMDYDDTAPMSLRHNPQLRLMHACAHHLVRYNEETSLHGPEFAKAFLTIVQRFLGREVRQELQLAFTTHKVKTRTWNAEARQRAKERYAERDLRSLLEELR